MKENERSREAQPVIYDCIDKQGSQNHSFVNTMNQISESFGIWF